ncbi:hypothetical protein Tco_0929531 [Tanacetum coccineum]
MMSWICWIYPAFDAEPTFVQSSHENFVGTKLSGSITLDIRKVQAMARFVGLLGVMLWTCYAVDAHGGLGSSWLCWLGTAWSCWRTATALGLMPALGAWALVSGFLLSAAPSWLTLSLARYCLLR